MKFIKNYLIIYCALGISLIPFAIVKYIGLKEYSGALNETLEGVFLILFFQLLEALLIYLIVKSIEKIFKTNIQFKYLFPALIFLQLLIIAVVV